MMEIFDNAPHTINEGGGAVLLKTIRFMDFASPSMFPDCEVYYRVRVESHPNGGFNMMGEWEFSDSYSYEVKVEAIPVLSHTPKGVWLGWKGGAKRFVLHSSRKRFADPTIEKAMETAIAKKKKHTSIMRARLKELENELEALEGKMPSYKCKTDALLVDYYGE